MNFIKYLTKQEASEYVSSELGLPLSDKTLSKYISQGGGPQYQKFGRRVVYTRENLINWVKSKLSSPLSGSFEEVRYEK